MRKREKKATPIRFHDGLQQLRKDAGGMDIGAREIWVDVGMENDAEPVPRFETFTPDLNWMANCGIKTVVMESTGVYWIPACQILEDRGIEVLLVNPRVCKECQWAQDQRTGLSMAADAALLRIIASVVSTGPRDCHPAQLL